MIFVGVNKMRHTFFLKAPRWVEGGGSVPTSSSRDNIARVNHRIRGIVRFGGQYSVIVLSLKGASNETHFTFLFFLIFFFGFCFNLVFIYFL